MKSLFSEKQMVERLGINRKTLYLWRKQGMPFQMLGIGRIGYNEKNVRKWCNANLKTIKER